MSDTNTPVLRGAAAANAARRAEREAIASNPVVIRAQERAAELIARATARAEAKLANERQAAYKKAHPGKRGRPAGVTKAVIEAREAAKREAAFNAEIAAIVDAAFAKPEEPEIATESVTEQEQDETATAVATEDETVAVASVG